MIDDQLILRVVYTVGGIAILGFIWWMFGGILNRRRVQELVWWIRDGLPALGEQGSSAWSGSSLFRMGIFQPRAPFSAVELDIALESREVPLLWLVGHMRGQHDTLILKCKFSPKPRVQIEAVRGDSPGASRILKQTLGPGWRTDEKLVDGWVVADRGMGSAKATEAMVDLLQQHGERLLRVSVSKENPHMLANVNLDRIEGVSSESVFRSIRRVAAAATGPDR